ncbi:MAG: A24 family peptidase [Phycisphaerae bacterium]|nr:A24 family peptidase [Phycisphaerae bacterium]
MNLFFSLTALFIAALGLAVGSFLNVVIYRLPHGISLARPRWSFCPHCGESIAGRDNLPVISWLLLRGRCRVCAAPISGQYPIVEAMTALIFTLVYFLLISESARAGLTTNAWAGGDWPYVIACLTLAAAMIACSAMDITSYSLDVRVTEFAVVVGLLMHVAWRRGELHTPLALSPWGAAGAAAALAALVMLWISNRAARRAESAGHPSAAADDDPSDDEPANEAAVSAIEAAGRRGAGRVPVVIAILLMLVLTSALVLSGVMGESRLAQSTRWWLAPLSLAIIYLVTVLAGSGHTDADAAVHEEIESEARFARATSLSELLWLAPAIVAGCAAYFAVAHSAYAADLWRGIVQWSPIAPFRPLAGLTYGLAGLAIAAALGWALRLFFTFAFGREAFGTGDIYILAAAGATIGPDIAALGLLAAVGLAMVAWMLAQLSKSTTLLPFGPPLAIGFLVALWLSRPATEIADNYRQSIAIAASEQPQLLWLLAGILLVGMGAAILAAKAVRRIVEPPATEDAGDHE